MAAPGAAGNTTQQRRLIPVLLLASTRQSCSTQDCSGSSGWNSSSTTRRLALITAVQSLVVPPAKASAIEAHLYLAELRPARQGQCIVASRYSRAAGLINHDDVVIVLFYSSVQSRVLPRVGRDNFAASRWSGQASPNLWVLVHSQAF